MVPLRISSAMREIRNGSLGIFIQASYVLVFEAISSKPQALHQIEESLGSSSAHLISLVIRLGRQQVHRNVSVCDFTQDKLYSKGPGAPSEYILFDGYTPGIR